MEIRTDLTRRPEKSLKAVKAVLSMWALAQLDKATAPIGKVKNENHSRLELASGLAVYTGVGISWSCTRQPCFARPSIGKSGSP